jgi:hypothetical protein
MTQRLNYNFDFLTKFCSDHHITLLKDYSIENNITQNTKIEGKCLTQNCENNFNKSFRQLLKTNAVCNKCSKKKKNNIIHDVILLKKFCCDNNIKLDDLCIGKSKEITINYNEFNDILKGKKHDNISLIKSNEPINRETRIIGKCRKCDIIYNKSFRVLIRINQYCIQCSKDIGIEKKEQTNIGIFVKPHAAQNDEIKQKTKATFLENHGVEHPMHLQKTKDKIKATFLENHGVEHPMHLQKTKDKIKETLFKNHGVEHQMHLQETKDKIKKTTLEKLGYEHNSQSPLIKQQKIITCLKNWGFENPQQNPEIAEKTSKSSYLRKDYTLPSGKIIQVQGYESFALDELVKIFNEDEIITGCGSVPEIWWHDKNGKKRRYYVDIFITCQNKCIEVKSTYTYKKELEENLLKQKAVKDAGYNCEIWIYNEKGKKLECIV